MTDFLTTHKDGLTVKIKLANQPWIRGEDFEHQEFTAYAVFDNEQPVYQICLANSSGEKEWQETDEENYLFNKELFPNGYGSSYRIPIGAKEDYLDQIYFEQSRLRLLQIIVPGRVVYNHNVFECASKLDHEEVFYIANIMKGKGSPYRLIFDFSPLLRSWTSSQKKQYDDFPAFLQLRYGIVERKDSCILAYTLVKAAYLGEWSAVKELISKASTKNSNALLDLLAKTSNEMASKNVIKVKS